MSVIGSNILAGASGQGGGYNLTRSLRFRGSAGGYLNRTFATGSATQWTFSTWVKRGTLGTNAFIFSPNNLNGEGIYFDSSNKFSIAINGALLLTSTAVYRDPSAWYHIVVASDMGNATASLRCRVYINGSEVTSWTTDARASYTSWGSFNSAINHNIAVSNANGIYFDGYLAETNFVGGQALTPSSFGETSTTTGVWQPKRYAGTYGTNGFYLPFTDNSALTTSSNVGLGKDFSGNGNYWNTNNISLTPQYAVQSLTSSTTWTAPAGVTSVEYLVVAGGGGGGGNVGGNQRAGGGGGGGILTGTLAVTAGNSYTVTIGSGGTAGSDSTAGGNGGNSVFASITAIGGGGGSSQSYAAQVGGSGGGGSSDPTAGAAGTSGQGYAGANGTGYNGVGGGGGGAGAAATNGNGGTGLLSSITGTSTYYAGGGGGSLNTTGGSGGGGNGATASAVGSAQSGTTNTGGGGGGGYGLSLGGTGGSGIVIIKYQISPAGATYDSMTDVPTLTSATASNFATFNPLVNSSGTYSATPTYSQANLLATGTADTKQYYSESTIYFSSGKFYAEFTPSAVTGNASYVGIGTENLYLYAPDGQYYNNGSWGAYGATYTTSDVVGVAVDATTGTIEFYKNGTSQGQKTIATGKTWVFRTSSYNTGASHSWTANFGQRPFAYTPPTGYVALNTFNLPTPTIGATASSQANKYFDATLYTGTGANQTITNSGAMQPDLVWVKVRSTTGTHVLTDSVRGANKQLFSNLTNAEASATNKITGFTSSGFTLGADDGSGTGDANFNGSTFVGWQWRASNATGVTNTAGSITSTVSANTTSGFSVVTYTGTGANATVGHGLGVAPSMAIIKRRSTSGSNWLVYHKSLTATSALYLNTTEAKQTFSDIWNNTAPTSTVMSLGTTDNCNLNGGTYVGYFFSEIAGYSKFGSYTGNGSTDGTFVYTGFRPKYVLIRRTDSGNNWFVLDSARNTYNLTNAQLYPNASSAEATGSDCNVDFLSNGFKLRTALDASNGSGGNYIYACFAENPFKYSLAR